MLKAALKRARLGETSVAVFLVLQGSARAQTVLPEIDIVVQKPQRDGSEAAGYRSGAASTLLLGDRSLQDTPYSVNVASRALMSNLQAASAQDALKYNPTVYEGAATNMVGGGSSFTIRGFTTDTNESYVDGLHLYASSPIEDKERIEVLNGPASFLFGFANPAGVVNYIMKRPTTTPYYSVVAGDFGAAQGYAHVDLSGPLDTDGAFAYRVNLAHVGSGETTISSQSHERSLASAALDWRAAESTKLMFDYSHYYFDIRGGDNLFTIGSALKTLPKAPDPSKNFMPAYARSYDMVDRAALRLTSKIDETFNVRGAFAYSDVDMFRNRPRDQITTNLGNYTMSRNYYRMNKEAIEGYLYLDAEIETFGWKHNATLGMTDEDVRYRYAYPYSTQTVSYSGVGNIYLPTAYPVDKPGAPIGPADKTFERTNLLTASFVDTVSLTDQWSLLAGVTFASIDDRNWSYSTYPTNGKVTEAPAYQKSAATPSAALTYKPWSNVTTYVSYIEALQKGPTAPSTTANANQTLAPYLAQQIEIGAKTSWGMFDVNVALFRIDKANAFTNTTTNVYSEDGRETHDGVEFVAMGKVLPELTVTGGFTLMHAKVTNADTASVVGKVPAATPQKLARLYAEYALPFASGLFLTGGFSYNGKIFADAANTLVLPSVVTGDLGLRYETRVFDHALALRVNVANISDEHYWSITPSTLTLGSPRTIFGSAQLTF
ncbi:TonB-dependent receptor [Methylosinus sp. LW4]|uniref:TonB-dependent receptor n=1 Tax=Methylosinus sp. LW4 TaxID=136993 RepID=UPI000A05DC55|nr:TonB-dependent siderophore receptor [Methylosinus sp. LW4]